jgi:carboxymethylenebutenolidase|tara:strand:+ start:581 stop:757 length:177 start_codon:yes stop_codon:yes gene_type:complete
LDFVSVKSNDPRLKSKFITSSSPKGGKEIKGSLAILENTKKKTPDLLDIHENRVFILI